MCAETLVGWMQSQKARTDKFDHRKFLSFGSMCGKEELFDNGLDVRPLSKMHKWLVRN